MTGLYASSKAWQYYTCAQSLPKVKIIKPNLFFTDHTTKKPYLVQLCLRLSAFPLRTVLPPEDCALTITCDDPDYVWCMRYATLQACHLRGMQQAVRGGFRLSAWNPQTLKSLNGLT